MIENKASLIPIIFFFYIQIVTKQKALSAAYLSIFRPAHKSLDKIFNLARQNFAKYWNSLKKSRNEKGSLRCLFGDAGRNVNQA